MGTGQGSKGLGARELPEGWEKRWGHVRLRSAMKTRLGQGPCRGFQGTGFWGSTRRDRERARLGEGWAWVESQLAF